MRGHARAWSPSDVSAASDLVAALPEVRAARTRDALARLAVRDSLTGLPNRALLLDRIEVALAEIQRTGRTVWVLFVDLDGFKEVNDRLGHHTGDLVLIEVASRLRRGARAADMVGRLGGDEFVVVCTEDATTAAMEELADRLLAVLAEPFEVGDGMVTVSGSIGIAAADGGTTPAATLQAADAAMYRAKHRGRNRAAW